MASQQKSLADQGKIRLSCRLTLVVNSKGLGFNSKKGQKKGQSRLFIYSDYLALRARDILGLALGHYDLCSVVATDPNGVDV